MQLFYLKSQTFTDKKKETKNYFSGIYSQQKTQSFFKVNPLQGPLNKNSGEKYHVLSFKIKIFVS